MIKLLWNMTAQEILVSSLVLPSAHSTKVITRYQATNSIVEPKTTSAEKVSLKLALQKFCIKTLIMIGNPLPSALQY